MREAVFALAPIEDHIVHEKARSQLVSAIDQAMTENSEYWTPYYRGDADSMMQLRHFSYSDRVRYYWTVPGVRHALKKMFSNLNNRKIPETIVSQYFPEREFGSLQASAEQLVADHISMCTGRYYQACGFSL